MAGPDIERERGNLAPRLICYEGACRREAKASGATRFALISKAYNLMAASRPPSAHSQGEHFGEQLNLTIV